MRSNQQVELVSSGHCAGSFSSLKLLPDIQESHLKRSDTSKSRSAAQRQRNVHHMFHGKTSLPHPVSGPSLLCTDAVCLVSCDLIWIFNEFINNFYPQSGYFLVVNQLPGYMKSVLHYDIKTNGLLSSLPYLGKYCMSVVASHLADYLRSTGKITTTLARKGFTAWVLTEMIMLVIMTDEYKFYVSIQIRCGAARHHVRAAYLLRSR